MATRSHIGFATSPLVTRRRTVAARAVRQEWLCKVLQLMCTVRLDIRLSLLLRMYQKQLASVTAQTSHMSSLNLWAASRSTETAFARLDFRPIFDVLPLSRGASADSQEGAREGALRRANSIPIAVADVAARSAKSVHEVAKVSAKGMREVKGALSRVAPLNLFEHDDTHSHMDDELVAILIDLTCTAAGTPNPRPNRGVCPIML
jgi:hypothetical protein